MGVEYQWRHWKRPDIKLLIEDFGKDPKMNKLIKDYYDLATDYSLKNRIRSFLHSGEGLRVLSRS